MSVLDLYNNGIKNLGCVQYHSLFTIYYTLYFSVCIFLSVTFMHDMVLCKILQWNEKSIFCELGFLPTVPQCNVSTTVSNDDSQVSKISVYGSLHSKLLCLLYKKQWMSQSEYTAPSIAANNNIHKDPVSVPPSSNILQKPMATTYNSTVT